MKTSFIFHLVLVFGVYCKISLAGQSDYQVSLYMQLHPNIISDRVCSGVILQSRVILTAASCVCYQVNHNASCIQIQPANVLIVGGNADKLKDVVVRSVASIHISAKFNSNSLENDLAIIRLNSSLPLSSRTDMSWIVMDDGDSNKNNCLANFNSGKHHNSVLSYIHTVELPILKLSECDQNDINHNRRNDFCSYYEIPEDVNCANFSEFAHFKSDRGTGLVCNSRLTAILSTILPLPENNNPDCSGTLLKAFYTSIAPHLDWIYSILAFEEHIDISQGNYIASVPYNQEAIRISQPIATESMFIISNSTEVPGTISTTLVEFPLNTGLRQKSSAFALLGFLTTFSFIHQNILSRYYNIQFANY